METWAFAMDKIVTLNTVAKVMRTFAFGAVSEEKNTTGCQLYLSKDSLETAITTAKSSEINVMVPGASPDRWRLEVIIDYKLTVTDRVSEGKETVHRGNHSQNVFYYNTVGGTCTASTVQPFVHRREVRDNTGLALRCLS
uniref:Adenylate cyclase-associated CAP C-terminal domain-containing protein n=1 Tax=Brassica oleracea TaxID=3712 RepID=A0A3P6ELX9_BRAOL|nr:unnamed protein product [Brassica oleracea]